MMLGIVDSLLRFHSLQHAFETAASQMAMESNINRLKL